MSIRENEAVAILEILAAIARADGTLHEDEKRSLAGAIEALELRGVTIDQLLAKQTSVKDQLAILESPEAREQVYRSACFMAYADGACSPEEQAILDAIEAAVGVSPDLKATMAGYFAPRRDSWYEVRAQSILDPEKRTAAVKKHVLRYAAVSAALGAFPVPGLAIATDLAVVALQVKMVRDIGRYYGHDVDPKSARSMLYTLGLGTGARLAVANLAKLLPGWGIAVGGASSFASTYALGKILERYFGDLGAGTKTDLGSLAKDMKAAEKEGKAAFAEQKDAIAKDEKVVAELVKEGKLDDIAARVDAG
jgi:uncharacterized protein (DUF697 family)/tellurite resistance protein